MIERAFAQKQISRLSGLVAFGALTRESLADLVNAIGAAESEELAEACIDSVLEEAMAQTRVPHASVIRRWVWDHQATEQATEARRRTANCSHCGGTGFEIVERDGLTGAKDCRCRTAALTT